MQVKMTYFYLISFKEILSLEMLGLGAWPVKVTLHKASVCSLSSHVLHICFRYFRVIVINWPWWSYITAKPISICDGTVHMDAAIPMLTLLGQRYIVECLQHNFCNLTVKYLMEFLTASGR